ncbi:MAG: hypothetical protein JKY93_12480 [Gammaproteobacteria bacterium]|nr:hypothetical protein [Gammaproteobacteria bacterium]
MPANQSFIKIEELGVFDVDFDLLKAGLKTQGKAVETLARRLVARNVVSQAGESPGKQSGKLQKTIKSKMFRNGMGVYITHKLKNDDDRYPFMLVHGTPTIKSRADYIGKAFTARRPAVVTMLKSTFKKSVKVRQINL